MRGGGRDFATVPQPSGFREADQRSQLWGAGFTLAAVVAPCMALGLAVVGPTRYRTFSLWFAAIGACLAGLAFHLSRPGWSEPLPWLIGRSPRTRALPDILPYEIAGRSVARDFARVVIALTCLAMAWLGGAIAATRAKR